MRTRVLNLFLPLVLSISLKAQDYFDADAGVKVYSLKGMIEQVNGGSTREWGVADAGKTVFTVGGGLGFLTFSGKGYEMDISVDVSYSVVNFFEKGYNSINGPGRFSSDGFGGGTTTIVGLDVMPVHILRVSDAPPLSARLGVGVNLNFFKTDNLTLSSSSFSTAGSGQGTLDVKAGLLVFYGVDFDMVLAEPYLQFAHLFPFGRQMILFDDPGSIGTIGVREVPKFLAVTIGVKVPFR